MRYAFLIGFFGVIATCSAQRILFIGNSLTYSNELPQTVKAIAAADGRKIMVESFALPDYALEDHWKEAHVLERISKTHFDFVVMQQGPSAMPESRSNLIEYAIRFAEFCQRNGAQPAFFAVWPSTQRAFDFDRVIESYAIASDTTHSIFVPAGKAWQQLQVIDKSISLYSADGFHPSEAGSFLAALVIYNSLFNRKDMVEIDHKKFGLRKLSDVQFENLKKAAAAVQKK